MSICFCKIMREKNFSLEPRDLFLFLVADTQLYKRLCPSVGPSVGWSVGRLVGP